MVRHKIISTIREAIVRKKKRIFFAHPPGRRPRKIICGAKEISWPPVTSFNFQCATPRGLIWLPTVGCNYSLFGEFWIQFQIVNMLHQGGSFVYSPEGALGHCLGKKIIVDFQLQGDSFVYSPEGHGLGKLKFSMSNLKVAHLITHLSRGGIGSRFGYSNFHFEFLFTFKFLCVSTRGIICWYTIGCSYPLFGAFVKSIVDEKKSIRTS